MNINYFKRTILNLTIFLSVNWQDLLILRYIYGNLEVNVSTNILKEGVILSRIIVNIILNSISIIATALCPFARKRCFKDFYFKYYFFKIFLFYYFLSYNDLPPFPFQEGRPDIHHCRRGRGVGGRGTEYYLRMRTKSQSILAVLKRAKLINFRPLLKNALSHNL